MKVELNGIQMCIYIHLSTYNNFNLILLTILKLHK